MTGVGDAGRERGADTPNIGAQAIAVIEPTRTGAKLSDASAGDSPVSGKATFRVTSRGVDLSLLFTGCQYTNYYAVRIYDDPDCESATERARTGNDEGRDGLPEMTCTGTSGVARVFYSRDGTDPEPWTIGDNPTRTNLVGRTLVIEARDAPAVPLACGKIVAQPPAGDAAVVHEGPLPAVAVSADLVGLCTWRRLVPTVTADCPDPKKVVDCAAVHCDVSQCADACADRVRCLEGQSESCPSTDPCDTTAACQACVSDLQSCMLGFCALTLACGEPKTPGGPCSKVEACCSKQGDLAQTCLDAIRKLEDLGGADSNCSGVMNDWDFNSHLNVPCDWTQ